MTTISLSDEIWQELNGAYRTPYDAGVSLGKLESTIESSKIKAIWQELWNELHHQGDVDLASYLALPQIVRIANNKPLDPVEVLAICGVIEQQRHLGNNPELPQEFLVYYKQGLLSLKQYALNILRTTNQSDAQNLALAAIATSNGKVRLGKAIMELNDEYVLEEFLKAF